MMNEDRVSLDVARLLKQKGFDIHVEGSYVEYLTEQIDPEYPEGGGAFGWKKGEVNYDSLYFGNNSASDYSCDDYTMFAAPTHAIVQKWLREKHNTEVWVKPFILDDITKEYLSYVNFFPVVNNKECISGSSADHFTYKTYPEAMEAAIVDALNRICL